MTDGLNRRLKEWSRPPEPRPPHAGCWCCRKPRRPYVSLIWRQPRRITQTGSDLGSEATAGAPDGSLN